MGLSNAERQKLHRDRRRVKAEVSDGAISELGVIRGKFVVQYRAHPGSWPEGPGAWYRDEDWDKDGSLVAVGEARLRALDPFANDRAAGIPCPALGVTARDIDHDLARGEAGADHRLGRDR